MWQSDGSTEAKELPILNALVSGQQNIRLQQPFQGTKNYILFSIFFNDTLIGLKNILTQFITLTHFSFRSKYAAKDAEQW